MPATLGHIGAQMLLTRIGLPQADTKWILAGCVIPDLPWILQRVVRAVGDVPAIELRLYVVAQSSLLMSLVLCACLALFSRRALSVFNVLAFGALLHFALDALQTKWANGVLLFAPLRWEPLNFGLFWPEDWPTYALYGLSLGVVFWMVFRDAPNGDDLRRPRGARARAAVVLLAVYFCAPLAMEKAAFAANVHSTKVLAEYGQRAGREIGIDRNRIVFENGVPHLRVWTGERLALTNSTLGAGALVSVKGVFETPSTLRVEDVHLHASGVRDIASYVSLLAIALWWGLCIARARGAF
ncbi:hypothetical protein J7400_18130 [Shimia sp. R9_2]|uniref:hypothetical protein n=1 Tax=Shimia sp. R9_2 TaxID=2821112 RepID=UPI001ADBCCDD|nr:hypothetical protein [Shimia sp. R9_2]MBO9398596.1 hypothetical protein [Shimia sp. R9_2]